MKKIFLICVLSLFVFQSIVCAQNFNFIGKTKEEVKTLMQKTKKEFSFTREVDTEDYHYLKFENEADTKTMLFIFNKGVCDYVKLMCDYSLMKNIVDSLNNNYQYQKNQSWIDYTSDEEYDCLIEMEKREWFFTLKTSRIKK